MIEKNGIQEETLWNKCQAAEFLNITPRTVENLMKGGVLPYVKLGRSVRFIPRTVRESLEKRMRNGH